MRTIMKKYLALVIAFALVFGILPLDCFTTTVKADEITPSASLDGQGTSESPYLIGNLNDWLKFANDVNNGINADKFYKMTDDITVDGSAEYTFTAGNKQDKKFSGTLDGTEHTFTVNNGTISISDNYATPFGYLNNATIENLKLAGTVVDVNSVMGGYAIESKGDCKFTNCINSIKINTAYIFNSAGFVQKNTGNIIFSQCLFNGSIVNWSEFYTIKNSAGFVHDNEGMISYVDCFQCSNVGDDVDDGDGYVFNHGQNADYTRTYILDPNRNIDPGTLRLYKEAPANVLTKPISVNGETYYGTVLVKISNLYPVYNYTGEVINIVPAVTFDGENVEGNDKYSFSITPDTVLGKGDYTFTLTAKENSGYFGSYSKSFKVMDALQTDDNGVILINSASDWEKIALNVNTGFKTYSGQTIKLMNDISISGTNIVGKKHRSYDDFSTYFEGTFDGNNHTITVNFDNNDDDFIGVAPFGYIKNATIKKLNVEGCISSCTEHTSGLVGFADGTNHIEKCNINAVIKTGHDYAGGIVGHALSSDTTIEACIFAGTITGVGGVRSNIGGIVGRSDDANLTIINCLENGTYSEIGSMHPIGLFGDNGTISRTYYFNVQKGQPENVCLVSGAYELYQTAPEGCETEPVTAQDEHVYYIIKSAKDLCIYGPTDWDILKTNLERGLSYDGLTVTLENNITVGSMVGSSDHPFDGTFDGKGNTLTFNYTADANESMYIAPFRFIKGAYIKNLTVDGTIGSSKEYTAGIAGKSEDTCRIENCLSKIVIESTVSYRASHGGFVGTSSGSLSFENCVFSGSITAGNAQYCGGFAGHVYGSVSYTGCLQKGSLEINNYSYTFNEGTSGTFINTYYLNPCEYTDTPAKRVYADKANVPNGIFTKKLLLADGSDYYCPVVADFSGLKENYNYTGDPIDIQKAVKFDGVEVSEGIEYTFTTEPATVRDQGTYSAIITAKEESGYYGQKTITFEVCEFETPAYDENEGAYLINDGQDWDTFVNSINVSGMSYRNETVKLVRDINVSSMVGTNEHMFDGTFDGGGKKISFYSSDAIAEYVAPFRYINDATIKDLTVDGQITTGVKYAAGIVGESNGNSVILDCESAIEIISNVDGDGTHGGFAAVNKGSTLRFSGCTFSGSIVGNLTTNCGGFIGYNSSYTPVSYTDCLQRGTLNIKEETGSDTFNRGTEGSFITTFFVDSYGSVSPQAGCVYTVAPTDVLTAKKTFTGDYEYFCLCDIDTDEAYAYTGDEITPDLIVTGPDRKLLKENIDYSVSIDPTPMKEKGFYTVTVNAMADTGFYGQKTVNVSVIDKIAYIDDLGKIRYKAYGEDVVLLGSNDTVWGGDKYYIADRDVTINERVYVNGTAYLILCDGATLTIPQGIGVDKDNTLVITGQSEGEGTGKLRIEGEFPANKSYAAIGGSNTVGNGEYGKCGTIIINGGDIKAVAKHGAGIGGASYGSSGNITINGGTVYAIGGANGWISSAGIGGGYSGNGNDAVITINGGKITALAGESNESNNANYGKGIGNGTNSKVDHTIRLGWRNSDDYIITDSLGGKVKFESEFVPQDSKKIATAGDFYGKTIKIVPACRVTFEYANGENPESFVVVPSKNEKISEPEAPEYPDSDYVFGGWYTTKGYTSEFDFDTVIDQNITLYAKWNKTGKRLVSFDSMGGSDVYAQYVSDGSTCTEPNAPSRKGYSFAGWYSDESCQTPYNFSETISADKILFAKWVPDQYTVSFDANTADEITGAMNAQEFFYGEEERKLTKNTIVRKGYTFTGWNTSKTGRGKQYTDEAYVRDISFVNENNVKLYAQWAANEYKIKYVLNGGTIDKENPTKYCITTDTIAFADPSNKNLPFVGWFDNPEFNGVPVTSVPKGSVGDRILYACWGIGSENIFISGDLTYDKTIKNPTIAVILGGSTLEKNVDYQYEFSSQEMKDAGEYTVTVNGLGPYNGSRVSKVFSILPKAVKVTEITGAVKTYDGTKEISGLSCPEDEIEGVLDGDTLTVSASGEFTDANAGTGKTINISEIVLEGASKGNYTLSESGQPTTATGAINKRKIKIKALDQTVGINDSVSSGSGMATVSDGSLVEGHAVSSIILNGNTENITTTGTVTPSEVHISDSLGADVTDNYEITEYQSGNLTVTKKKAKITEMPTEATGLEYIGSPLELLTSSGSADTSIEFSLTGNDWTEDNLKCTDAGTYVIYYRAKADDIHTAGDVAQLSVTISKASVNNVSVSIDGWKYGENAKTPSCTADFGKENVSYSYSDKADGTFTEVVPSAAGTWYVKAEIPGTDNYSGGSGVVQFVVAGIPVTITAEDKTSKQGEALKELTFTTEGILEGDDLGISLSTTATSSSEAGVYDIEIKYNDNPNYNVTLVNGKYTIEKSNTPGNNTNGGSAGGNGGTTGGNGADSDTSSNVKEEQADTETTSITDDDGLTTVTRITKDKNGNAVKTVVEITDPDGNELSRTVTTISETKKTFITNTDTVYADGSSVSVAEKKYKSGNTSVRKEEKTTAGVTSIFKETVKAEKDGKVITTRVYAEKNGNGKTIAKETTKESLTKDQEGNIVLVTEKKNLAGESGVTELRIDVAGNAILTGSFTKTDGTTDTFTFVINSKKKVKLTKYIPGGTKAVFIDQIEINGQQLPVSILGARVMKGNKDVAAVVIGPNVKTIGYKAFYGDSNLKEIELTNSVKKISKYAFKNIAPNAVFTIKAPSKKEFNRVKALIKESGVDKKVKFKMVKTTEK